MKKLLLLIFCLIFLFSFADEKKEADDAGVINESTQKQLEDILLEQNSEEDYVVGDEKEEKAGEEHKAVQEKSFRLLILGIDTHDDDIKGRADTIMLASLSDKQLKLLSFMRDLYVEIPGRGHNKINASYAFGEAELLKKTLKKNFSVEVDGYIAVNFDLMRKLIDELGGVYIDVLPEEHKSLNAIMEYYNRVNKRNKYEEHLKKPGYQKLTGLQAMSYARIRKLDSDFERVGRQQRVMSAIFRELQTKKLDEILRIISKYIDKVKTDISYSDAIELASMLIQKQDIDIKLLRIPVKGSSSAREINKTYFIVPNYKKNIEAIKNFFNNVE